MKAARVLTPPTIDGRLDDPSWANAARITDFVQRRPLDGAPATERTEVLIAYDSDRLYFGIYAHYSDASIVRANRVDRDQIWNDDRVSVIFDPFRDQQRGYRFAINAYQFTERLLVRNITEHNTLDKTVGENLLLTYRVNAGTVFYLGFDTRYRHADQINPNVFPTDAYTRTNRAIFTKLQYLFRC